MLKDAVDFAKQVMGLTRKQQQHEEDIKTLFQDMKEVRQELRSIAEAMQEARFERHATGKMPPMNVKTCCYAWIS